MLRLRNGKLRWSDGKRELGRMARILGEEPALRLNAPVQPSTVRLALRLGVECDRASKAILAQMRTTVARAMGVAAFTDVEPTSPLEARAFPHQRVALAFFRAMDEHGYRSFLLADQPGVGKTLAAILRAHEVESQRTLVICPNSAKRQWRREVKRYLGAKTRVSIVDGTIDEQNQQTRRGGWVIGHWESLVHARDGYLAYPWDTVIADEAHFGSNRDAQRTLTLHKLKATHKLALTGHPYANDPTELFAILQFLYPEVYTSYWRFVGMHVELVPKRFGGHHIIGASRPKLLQWELAPFTLRRTKREVFGDRYKQVPRIPREVELTAKGKREYANLRQQLFAELEGIDGNDKLLPILSELSRLTRLRQYLIDPGLLGGREPSVKYPEVRALLDELDGPLVLFTSFAEAAKRLSTFLTRGRKAKKVACLVGEVKQRDRARMQQRFLAGDFDLMVVQTQLGGTALNLGKFGYVGHLDLPWNARDLEQSESRVDRPEEGTGLLVPTTSWQIVVADSYEQKLMEKLEHKHAMFRDVFKVSDLRNLFE